MHNRVLVKIEGKNVLNYIKWLITNKINVINMEIKNHNLLYLTIDYKYYGLLNKYSKTYIITIIKKYGRLRLIDIIKNNLTIITSVIISIALLYYLSGYIFSIDVIYNDQKMTDTITKELAKYGIKKYQRKKSYDYVNTVKNKILKDNKDILEWLEIEKSGTKYIVKLVERKQNTRLNEFSFQSIIAKKDATIIEIKAISGEKIKKENEYVKSGDVVISGIITKPDGTNIYTKANGRVLGEVWYKIDIDYPIYYQEESLTGKSKSVLAFYFLKKEIPIFPYKRYKNFSRNQTILFESNFIPIKLVKEKLFEVNIKENIYTSEQAAIIAISKAIEKLKNKNQSIVSIKDYKVLDKQNLNSKIKLNLFVSTIEDITLTKKEIEPNIVEN